MEILLAALVSATVSGAVVLLAPRVRGPPAGRSAPRRRAGRRIRRGARATQPRQSRQARARRHGVTRLTPRRRRGSTLRERVTPTRRATSSGPRLEGPASTSMRELERVSGLSTGQARQILLARARGRAAPRQRPADPPGRGRDPPRRRPARAQHPRRLRCSGSPAGTRPRPRSRSIELEVRRAEGPDHRPRGAQHPRARDPHRDRLHHRRHPGRRPALRLRRRPARGRAAHAGEAARRRPHPPGADRGGLRPGAARSSTAGSPSWASRRRTRPASGPSTLS